MASAGALAAVTEPVSPDDPCGPDLDGQGDAEYGQCVSRIEGILPGSFFTRDDNGRLQPFDRGTIEFAAEFKRLATLQARTRDLRLLTLGARLAALNRDLPTLAETFGAIGRLLVERWTEVHPRADEGDYGLRAAVLSTLDDMPTLVLPLQHMPLATSRRFGTVTFRALMAASGEVQVPEGETAPDRAALERALGDADLDALRAVRDQVAAVGAASDTIRATTTEQIGFEGAVVLERLPALAGRILAALDPAIAARDPAAALPAPPAGPAPDPGDTAPAPAGAGAMPARPPGAIRSAADARRRLTAVAAYFRRAEPSSPAEPLVRQAAELVGRSFVEVVRTLVPERADEARIGIGSDRVFALTFGQMADLAGPDDEAGEPDAEAPDRPSEDAVRIATRAEAVAGLQAAIAYFRASEPSSPIPLLLERAIGTVERDFLALLKDVLPGLFVRE